MIIQIYAFTKVKEAIAAVNLGVNNVGFVAGLYDMVFGELSFADAHEIVCSLPDSGTSTAITMSADVDEILRMADAVQPDILHISSELEEVDLDMMAQIRKRLAPDIKLMKAIPVDDEESVKIAQDFAQVSDALLLDTSCKGFPGVGATGFVHDWNVSRKIVASVDIPVILAGGLDKDNVGEAITKVRPWGVDSNTSTNVEGSRVEKDLKRIEEFVKAVQKSEFYEKEVN
jgi:phosphoribosylanthranilate isomerase